MGEADVLKAEAKGVGVGNLRGLLHPFIDYDATPAWLNEPVDPMDDEGFVHISPDPGLGMDINWDYINKNLT